MRKQFGYWDIKLQCYVKAPNYRTAADASRGRVKVLDKGQWRGCGLYEIPESAWQSEKGKSPER